MELELEQLIATFREEAAEGLAAAEAALVELESRPDDGEAVATVFRVMHTLKGTAGSLSISSNRASEAVVVPAGKCLTSQATVPAGAHPVLGKLAVVDCP